MLFQDRQLIILIIKDAPTGRAPGHVFEFRLPPRAILLPHGSGFRASGAVRVCASTTMAANRGSLRSDFNSSSDSILTCSLEVGKPFSTALRRTPRASSGLWSVASTQTRP